jgi:hypothetical protein
VWILVWGGGGCALLCVMTAIVIFRRLCTDSTLSRRGRTNPHHKRQPRIGGRDSGLAYEGSLLIENFHTFLINTMMPPLCTSRNGRDPGGSRHKTEQLKQTPHPPTFRPFFCDEDISRLCGPD